MNNRSICILIVLVFTFNVTEAQRLNKSDRALLNNLKSHVVFLSDDKLEGRRAGTKGEKLAAEYIAKEFEKIGLKPGGKNASWTQPFAIYDGKQVNPATHLILNGHDLKLNQEFFPLSFSPNYSGESAVAMALTERGVPWFMDVRETLDQNKNNPHFDLSEELRLKADAIAEKGATALIVYNTSDSTDGLNFNSRDRRPSAKIPVFYVTKDVKNKYLSDDAATIDIKLKTDIGLKPRTGTNVVGLLDNGAPTTVIIGAHFDHLGYGEDGNSMLRSDAQTRAGIHNGADDNASGTAAMLELARKMKQSKAKNHNFLFIAFSGEELGLNGSKHFTDSSGYSLDKVSYMINLDMVGRYDGSKGLTIGGIGTSPVWGQVLPGLKQAKSMVIKFDSSGTGPSDHTSFYRKNIPVLFFFTGLHSDYHRPTDDFDKINYNGQVQIVNYITELLGKTISNTKIAFTPTREQQTTTTARFSVSLGIMPDYTFSGAGVRVDGVSAGRAAEKIGMKTGDVITHLGDFDTNSMEAYMQALSKFKKGDKTRVKYKRGTENLEADVEF